jgi:hypothetical protein
VLCGIGGRTVEEAKANLSYVEFLDWCTYANKTGTLNLGLRLEHGLAMVAFLLTKGFKIKKDNNKQFTLQDFLPHIQPEESEDGEVTLESAMRALGVPR